VPWYATSRLPTTPAASPGAAGCFPSQWRGNVVRLSFTWEGEILALVLLLLLSILILGGVGIAAAKLLLWIALILLVVWIAVFFARGAEGARWYRC
jgi:hypothetical protein